MRKPKKVNAPQWVELSNLTSTALDCAQWGSKGLNLIYTFEDFQPDSPADGFIAPFETWIISDTSPEDFRHYYPESQNTRILGPWTGFISEQKDHLVLVDKNQLPMTGVAMRKVRHGQRLSTGQDTHGKLQPQSKSHGLAKLETKSCNRWHPGTWTLLNKNNPNGHLTIQWSLHAGHSSKLRNPSMTIVLASDQEDQLRLENYQILSHPDLKPLIQLKKAHSPQKEPAHLIARSTSCHLPLKVFISLMLKRSPMC